MSSQDMVQAAAMPLPAYLTSHTFRDAEHFICVQGHYLCQAIAYLPIPLGFQTVAVCRTMER